MLPLLVTRRCRLQAAPSAATQQQEAQQPAAERAQQPAAEEEEPIWVRRERERQAQKEAGGSGELPFGAYLLFSAFTAIAAVSWQPLPYLPAAISVAAAAAAAGLKRQLCTIRQLWYDSCASCSSLWAVCSCTGPSAPGKLSHQQHTGIPPAGPSLLPPAIGSIFHL